MTAPLTDYQAKYFAYELQRSYANDHVGKLAGLLFDAQVEPKPHQIDAALFALQTPFLPGVILADEVGLGKTIEAGIVISQYWAELKRRILIIAPSSLRQQWKQELYEKFLIPSTILDAKSKDSVLARTDTRAAEVLICSYDFVLRHETSLLRSWDLVVAYELIMQQKERLLDENEPTRFVFSHSALREGWDNPNVFQICTLREMGAETERRQTLGRGLRLPVAKSAGGYERVADRGIATLTVVANESYKQFAEALQKEYKDAGAEIGRVRKAEFSKIPLQNPDGSLTDENLGYEGSVSIWEHLLTQKFIDKDGVVQPKFQPNTLDFSLNMPVDFMWAEPFVIELVGRANIGKYVKPKSKRHSRKLNKELFANPEFEKSWETISRRTTYRVEVERDQIIENSVSAIKEAPDIDPLRIQVTRAGVKVLRGGAKGQELGTRQQELRGSYELPDIIGELQEATSLTRKTIVDVLVGSGRLREFIAMTKRLMQTELAKLVVDGVQYEKIAGSVYELRELRKDGEEEKERFLDQMYKLENADKSDFDYVVYDSDPERQFAELLDGREDIKFFMKLPDKFKIDTPVGPYNPDWAIVKHEDGEERVYMIRETKSTEDEIKRRPTENAKIKAAKQHFEAIGVPDYAVSVPGKWRI
ncbi:SNF2-related protein [Brachybacterium sp. sponge]|uniref:restriction endonuclease n=1 Tax=Brachybacterium sp. sponge TaxID=1775432 RepID=UPI0009EF5266|nr:SNF2-related protein [Brachybacterium sp. sponge]